MSDLMTLQGHHTRVTHTYKRKNFVWALAIVAFLLALWIFVDFEAMAGVALIGIAMQAVTITYQILIADSASAEATSHLYVGLVDRLDEQSERLTRVESYLAANGSQGENHQF